MNIPDPGASAAAAWRSWKKRLEPYQRPDLRRSTIQLANSVIPYVVLWLIAWRLLGVSYWATLGVCILAAGFLVRVFIISHDCGHGSFFHSRRANSLWGGLTSALVFIPYYAWRHEHAVHHASSGNLDRRGVGDIRTMTVREYAAASRWKRWKYRMYRHPLVMFGVGPLYTFLVSYRFWPPNATRRVKISTVRTNVGLLLLAVGVSALIGVKAYLAVQLSIMAIAGAAGVWLFYVQHQFEGVYWERTEDWDFIRQAIEGSSYYKLPKVLQWFSGNIGFHHVHHLSARIPNYFLEKCQREIVALQNVKPITLRTSLRSLKFRLWDEDRNRLIGFSELRSCAHGV